MSQQPDSSRAIALPTLIREVPSSKRLRELEPAGGTPFADTGSYIRSALAASSEHGSRFAEPHTAAAVPGPARSLGYLASLVLAVPLALLTSIALCFVTLED